MYSKLPNYILGFHGCDQKVAERVLSGQDQHLPRSANDYDWLGHGIYFWEQNPFRAIEYARDLKANPGRTSKGKDPIKTPAVVGAIIDLGACLNLLESKSIEIVKASYDHLVATTQAVGGVLPVNVGGRMYLDCTVIQTTHELMERQGNAHHSVRGVFVEGPKLFPNSNFHDKNHIQICVCNPNCIKGYFRIMTPLEDFPIP
jgi:hypothetical protein